MKGNKKIMEKLEAFDMDWGEITPEFCSHKEKSVVHVFNHYLEGQENIDRCIRFAIGRINWYKSILPHGYTQMVMFDDRGQNITDEDRKNIMSKLKDYTSETDFLSRR